jgi:hypothetical protein
MADSGQNPDEWVVAELEPKCWQKHEPVKRGVDPTSDVYQFLAAVKANCLMCLKHAGAEYGGSDEVQQGLHRYIVCRLGRCLDGAQVLDRAAKRWPERPGLCG